jgi:hypothetical protein
MHHKGHKDEYFKTIFAEKHKNKPTQKGTIFQIAFSTSGFLKNSLSGFSSSYKLPNLLPKSYSDHLK